MRGPQDAIHDRVAQVDVRGGHVDLRSQRARAVGEQAVLHALKEAEIFGARVIDSSTDGFVIEATGDTEKIEEFLEVMRSYGEIEVSRSGAVAMSLAGKKLRLQPPVPTRVDMVRI